MRALREFFPVEDFENKHLIIITGGTGMAPVKTMLDYFSENQDKLKSLHMISGFRDLDCVLFTEKSISTNVISTICSLIIWKRLVLKKG